MVSQITEAHSTDPNGRPYKHRRRIPALVVLILLLGAVAVVWTRAVSLEEPPVNAIDCPAPPPGGPELGEPFSRNELAQVPPAPLRLTQVRVYNANGEVGQASAVAAQLSELGYQPAADVQAGNDPLYTDQNMQCHGQIRFGPEGRAAASALWLAAPCVELIEDARPDNTVDLALGTYFGDISPTPEGEAVIQLLRSGDGGGPTTDLVEKARAALC
ncbi:envelope integrity protein Cei [Hoyosella sp. G463]|uniref:Envelope integrity protein Cei n=1 Tax=Lolliginicoccus lacisalsi TaxID=2742202 RepID=A0A927PK67_9ACTN|nr:envelope integrity protein Cei [Lolliginicoccus lacisalsi]